MEMSDLDLLSEIPAQSLLEALNPLQFSQFGLNLSDNKDLYMEYATVIVKFKGVLDIKGLADDPTPVPLFFFEPSVHTATVRWNVPSPDALLDMCMFSDSKFSRSLGDLLMIVLHIL